MLPRARSAHCATTFCLLVALGLPLQQAWAVDPTDGPRITLTAVSGPAGKGALASPLAEPVLLCGNRWVTGTYVVGSNCYRACISRGGTPASCKASGWVARCQACWSQLMGCPQWTNLSPAAKCRQCSAKYAACMGPLL
jgi:hypothetical protein